MTDVLADQFDDLRNIQGTSFDDLHSAVDIINISHGDTIQISYDSHATQTPRIDELTHAGTSQTSGDHDISHVDQDLSRTC